MGHDPKKESWGFLLIILNFKKKISPKIPCNSKSQLVLLLVNNYILNIKNNICRIKSRKIRKKNARLNKEFGCDRMGGAWWI